LRSSPSTIKGVNSITGDDTDPAAQVFYDYLTHPELDMIRIELEILGDPAYICQDIYTPIHRNRETTAFADGLANAYNMNSSSFNADAWQPIIAVNYRIPTDLNDKKGLMFNEGGKWREENLFFNGLYQVNKIENRFHQGAFTQVLHCSRFNNQQGYGDMPAIINEANATKKLNEIYKKTQEAKDPRNNTFVQDAIKRQAMKKRKGSMKRSDIRLKENIQLIGRSLSNINIYSFKYKGEQGYYEGVMAQEVPWASIVGDDGYLMVDYSKVDVEFKKRG
jgi:hypothetical protein